MRFQSYIICATPRSGSTLLCDMLAGTGVTGHPNSFYRHLSIPNWVERWKLDADTPDFDRVYLDAALKAGNAGMFGMRQMWDHKLEMDAALARLYPTLSEWERLEAAFGSIRFLYLQREDVIAQAVSRAMAEQSGLWHQHADGSTREQVGERKDPIYDRDQIVRYVSEAKADNQRWEDWFTANNITPLRLTYEALAADPQAELDRIMSDFGLAPVKATIKSRKLSDALSKAWIKQYQKP